MRFLLYGSVNFLPAGSRKFFETIEDNTEDALLRAKTTIRNMHMAYRIMPNYILNANLSLIKEVRMYRAGTTESLKVFDVANDSRVSKLLCWGEVSFRSFQHDQKRKYHFFEIFEKEMQDKSYREAEKMITAICRDNGRLSSYRLWAFLSGIEEVCSFRSSLCEEYGHTLYIRESEDHENTCLSGGQTQIRRPSSAVI